MLHDQFVISETESVLGAMIMAQEAIHIFDARFKSDIKLLKKELEDRVDLEKMKSEFVTIPIASVTAFRNKRRDDAGVYVEYSLESGGNAMTGIEFASEESRQYLVTHLSFQYNFFNKKEVPGAASTAPFYSMFAILLLLVPLYVMTYIFDIDEDPHKGRGKAKLIGLFVRTIRPEGLLFLIALTIAVSFYRYHRNKRNLPIDVQYTR